MVVKNAAAMLSENARPTRLPGSLPVLRLSLGVTQMALWLGPNGLILSQLHFYKESYRQFDFANIEAIVVRKTFRGAIYGLIIAAIAGWFGWASWFVEDPRAGILAAVFAVLWSGLYAVNLLRGPTCRVQLQTRLGVRELPTLTRVRTTRRATRLIFAAVERAQGPLTPAEAAERMEGFLKRGDDAARLINRPVN